MDLVPLCSKIVKALSARSQTISFAESLTGGGLAAELTNVPGSSSVFQGGVVAYSNDVKHRLLHVDRKILDPPGPGPVSQEAAKAMAEGVRSALSTEWGVSTTGWAGDGTQRQRPASNGSLAAVVSCLPTPQPSIDDRLSDAGDGQTNGLVFIHIVGPADVSMGRRFVFEGDRWQNRNSAIDEALKLIAEVISV